MITKKYCIIISCPDYYGHPEIRYCKDPGAANFVGIIYGDTPKDLWREDLQCNLYQLYAIDTGERVGHGIYRYKNIAKDVYEADIVERKMPDVRWIDELWDEENDDYRQYW